MVPLGTFVSYLPLGYSCMSMENVLPFLWPHLQWPAEPRVRQAVECVCWVSKRIVDLCWQKQRVGNFVTPFICGDLTCLIALLVEPALNTFNITRHVFWWRRVWPFFLGDPSALVGTQGIPIVHELSQGSSIYHRSWWVWIWDINQP